jgi:AsmA-like C-terminal region
MQKLSSRKKRWIYGISGVVALAIVALFIAASVLSRRFEPFIREQAIRYMSERFNSDVQIASLRIKMPKMSPLNVLLRRGRGATAGVQGEGITMRYKNTPDLPELFSIDKFKLEVDLGTLFEDTKIVQLVQLEGMKINIPPKGERRALTSSSTSGEDTPTKVLIREVRIHNGELKILPKDKTKNPLDFNLQRVILKSTGVGRPMNYDAYLTNPKPPGRIHSTGAFGPWVTDEPSSTPLKGDYEFNKADLSVFKSIAGILNSTGSFEGVLSSITAKGQATVPDFRLTMANNPVPLSTQFEVLVDGTNGNTVLQPVKATLGSTRFQTSGAIIKHEGDKRRHIDLDVSMPNGNLRDVLRLAMKGAPFMEGSLFLKTKISLPPLSGKVREKLQLNGSFKISNGKFLRSTIQDEIDKLSRKGQGEPTSQEIDEVVSGMNGSFRMDNERITFRKLGFTVPGAAVELAGTYDLDADHLDFLGTLKLQARVSETMTGWKRIALKPVDPFFAKNGAGTFLRISVEGPSRKPKFGLARNRKDSGNEESSAQSRARTAR